MRLMFDLEQRRYVDAFNIPLFNTWNPSIFITFTPPISTLLRLRTAISFLLPGRGGTVGGGGEDTGADTDSSQLASQHTLATYLRKLGGYQPAFIRRLKLEAVMEMFPGIPDLN